jgi:hypothetical protein
MVLPNRLTVYHSDISSWADFFAHAAVITFCIHLEFFVTAHGQPVSQWVYKRCNDFVMQI